MGCGISQEKYKKINLNIKMRGVNSMTDIHDFRLRDFIFNDDLSKFTSFDLTMKKYNSKLKDVIVDMNYDSHHEKIYEIYKNRTETIQKLRRGYFEKSQSYHIGKNKNMALDIVNVIKKILNDKNKYYNNLFFKMKRLDCCSESLLLNKCYSKYNMTIVNTYDTPIRIIIEFDQKKNNLVPKYYETTLIPTFTLLINNRYSVKYVYIVCSCGIMCIPYNLGQVFRVSDKKEFRDTFGIDSFGIEIKNNVNFVDFYLIPICCICDCENMEEQRKNDNLRNSLPNVYSVKGKLVSTINKIFRSYDHRDDCVYESIRDYKDLFPHYEV
jgi:hypothetical protein